MIYSKSIVAKKYLQVNKKKENSKKETSKNRNGKKKFD